MSASDEMETNDHLTPFNTEHHEDLLLSTWGAKVGNLRRLEGNGESLTLQYGDILTIIGQYRLRVRYGIVSIAGATLMSGSQLRKVVAPSTDALPSIRCVSGDGAEIEVHSVTETEDIAALAIVNSIYGQIWTCKCIKCSVTVSQGTYTKLHRSSDVHQRKGVVPQLLPLDWQQHISQLGRSNLDAQGASTLTVFGSSDTETWALSQLVINTFLSEPRSNLRSVLLLDLDHKSPIAGDPGHATISLLSEPIMRPAWCRTGEPSVQNICSYAIGSSYKSFRYDSIWQQYEAEASTLLSQYSSAIILIRCLPTQNLYRSPFLLQQLRTRAIGTILCTSTDTEHLANQLRVSDMGKILTFSSLAEPRTHAIDLGLKARLTLQMDFHLDQGRQGGFSRSPLTARRPVVVNYDASRNMRADFLCVAFLGELPPMYPQMLRTLLNGTLTSIAILDSDSHIGPSSIARGLGDDIPFLTKAANIQSRCRVVALALIRAIDVENKQFHLLLPTQLVDIDVSRAILIAGAMETPDWAYRESLAYNNSPVAQIEATKLRKSDQVSRLDKDEPGHCVLSTQMAERHRKKQPSTPWMFTEAH